MQESTNDDSKNESAKISRFTKKRHDEIKTLISRICINDDHTESIMSGIREIMNFDVNRKYYDEKKKKEIYAYRAKLKERKEAEKQKNDKNT